jgi:hypothetical protein
VQSILYPISGCRFTSAHSSSVNFPGLLNIFSSIEILPISLTKHNVLSSSISSFDNPTANPKSLLKFETL